MRSLLGRFVYRNKNIGILLIYVLLTVVYFLLLNSDYQSFLIGGGDSSGGRSGLIFFYSLYSGIDSGIFIIFIMLSYSLIYAFDAFSAYNLKNDRIEIIRVGYPKYYKSIMVRSIKSVWFFPLVINGVFILLLFLSGYPWETSIPHLIFGFTQEVDFILFIVFQVLGWSVFNMFLTLISQLLNNKYVFGVFGFAFSLVVLLGSLLMSIPLGSLTLPVVGSISSFLVFLTSPLTLISAGQFVLISGYTNLWAIVLMSILLYCLLSMILYKFILSRRLKQHYVFA